MIRGQSFRLRVPASTSNLGPGFDCFGMAFGLQLEVEVRPAPSLTITAEGGPVPLDASNLVVRTMLDALGPGIPEPAIALHLRNRIPLARGLGSSASARVAGLAIAVALQDGWERVQRGRERIREAACALEHHPDNANPAVLGGFCIGAPGRGFERVEMDAREYLVIVPELEIHTAEARAVLPTSVPLPDAIFNLQRAALTAVRIARAGNLGAALPFEDALHQRRRLALDPRLEAAFGALAGLPRLEGAFLSGSGSTVIALPHLDAVEAAQLDCARAFRQCGLEVTVHRLAADNAGLQVEAL